MVKVKYLMTIFRFDHVADRRTKNDFMIGALVPFFYFVAYDASLVNGSTLFGNPCDFNLVRAKNLMISVWESGNDSGNYCDE